MDQLYRKRLNIQRAAAFLLTALFLIATYLIASERLNKLETAANEAMAASGELTKMDATRTSVANDIRFHAEQSEAQLALLFFISDKEKRIPVYGKMDAHKAALDQAIERISLLLTNAEDKGILSRLISLRETFRNNLQETVDALELDDREKAVQLLSSTTRNNLQDLRILVDELVSGQQDILLKNENAAQTKKTGIEANLSRASTITIGAGWCAAAIGLLLGLMLMRSTVRPE
jgi:hypothetical protein